MQQIVLSRGYEMVDFSEKADIYVVNTCTVTNIADRKSRQMLHRAKQLNPEAVVVAVGCYAQTGTADLTRDSAVDLIIGNNHKAQLADILEKHLKEKGLWDDSIVSGDCPEEGTFVDDLSRECRYEAMTLTQTAEHTRAYIKIQDGCNQFCSYCLIPYARGRVRSRGANEIVREITDLVAKGYREVVLTGIHISSYGIDLDDDAWARGLSIPKERAETEMLDYRGETKLIDLMEKVSAIPGLERLRMGSFEPRAITPESAARMAALPNLCPHFHLSLQSGCDATLQRMNRHYTTEEFLEGVRILREAFDRPAITTDVIVGFPGETAEEFETGRAYLEGISFYEMHVFQYSKRKGTRAEKMPDQVPEPEKARRSKILLEMTARQSKAFREKYLNETVEVLFEEEKRIAGRKCIVGYTRDYVRIAVPAESEIPCGEMVTVRVFGFLTEDTLLGEKA
jgi:threonylcarbamoyladenosine tRNA methylthiotransferase MtaB